MRPISNTDKCIKISSSLGLVKGVTAMIDWQYFPKSDPLPTHLSSVIDAFIKHQYAIASPEKTLVSNEVLAVLRGDLISLGFEVETGKKAS